MPSCVRTGWRLKYNTRHHIVNLASEGLIGTGVKLEREIARTRPVFALLLLLKLCVLHLFNGV